MPKLPKAEVVAERIRKKCGLQPRLGIVLGSGFQELGRQVADPYEIPYSALPGFPATRVAGHRGRLLLGCINSVPVAVLSGRAHFYEGHSMEAVAFPTRVLAALGVQDLLLTNAAGGINQHFRPGDFMILKDHINFMGVNPLRGELPAGRERFVDMTRVYDPELRGMLKAAGKKIRLPLREGIYMAVPGPCYETPAEIRAFARLGADAVGMSTVPEAIVARQCKLRVAALSCITNLAAGRGKTAISHEEVLATGKQVKESAAQLVVAFTGIYARDQ